MSPGFDYARKLAEALEEQGRHDDAESAYRLALYDSPEDSGLYLGLGDCLRAQGRRADALDAYIAAVDFDPDSADAHFGLGLCELHPLRRAQAFAEATRCQPDHARAHLAHGEALLLLSRPDDALESLRRAQELAPGDLDVASRAGQALIAAGHIHDAARFLEQAIAEHPIGDHSAAGLGELYRTLADALAALGRHRDAMEAFRAADYLLPDELDTDPGLGETGTEPAALSIAGFSHLGDSYGEPTDPDAERTEPDGETTAPPT